MKKIVIGIGIILALVVCVVFIFQQNKSTNFEDIVSLKTEEIACIEVEKRVGDTLERRINIDKKEEIQTFLNEFSGLKLKKSNGISGYNDVYFIQIKPDDIHLDYLITVPDNNRISIHHYSQNATPMFYEIKNNGKVNLEKFFQ